MEIRIATPEDIERITDMLCVEMAPEVAEDAERDEVRHMVQLSVGKALTLIAVDGDELIGGIGLDNKRSWYSRAEYLGDYFIFVRKAHRGTRTVFSLLKMANAVAALHRKRLVISALASGKTDKKMQFFGRRMKFMGGVFLAYDPESGRA